MPLYHNSEEELSEDDDDDDDEIDDDEEEVCRITEISPRYRRDIAEISIGG